MFWHIRQRITAVRGAATWLLLAMLLTAFKMAPDGNEYQIKAMFVFNFTKYVEWPEKNTEVFKIGILGESEIGEYLEKIAAQKKVGAKTIAVDYIDLDNQENFDIIIVSRLRTGKLEQVEKKYFGKGVLIISDESPRSAAINLVTRDNKIRFEINPQLAKSGGVKISGQLISLALKVH